MAPASENTHKGWMSPFCLLLALAVAGCGGSDGPQRAAVHGKVTVAGEPVEGGSITFIPVDGNSGPTAGATIDPGEYSIPAENGPVTGTNRVDIYGTRKTGRKVPSEMNPNVIVDEFVEMVPAKYRANSPLKVEVNSGELDFDLEAE